MDNIIEKLISKSARCYTCGGLVYNTEKKMTTNHIYHNHCFRCRICKRKLTASSLNEDGDDIYCENCYRKKQRGDCSSLEFQRAAAERAQYVYYKHHPDQELPASNPQRPIQSDLSRHPSWTLRQIERQFLSEQPFDSKLSQKINDNFQKLISVSHPKTIKISFSAPNNLVKDRHKSSLSNYEPSPPFEFLPAYSPFSSNYTGSTATTPKTAKTPKTPNKSYETKINSSNIKLTSILSPTAERRYSSIINTNQYKDDKESIFRFPDTNISPPSRRRSSSMNYLMNRRKFK